MRFFKRDFCNLVWGGGVGKGGWKGGLEKGWEGVGEGVGEGLGEGWGGLGFLYFKDPVEKKNN